MRYLIVCGGKIDKEFGLNEIKTDGIDAIIAEIGRASCRERV